MALVDICEQITNSIDNHDYCAGVFIDLSKAFDSTDHTILLTKLQHCGIRGVTLDWFRDYLQVEFSLSRLKTFILVMVI